jgi:putative NADH-flavin reductase
MNLTVFGASGRTGRLLLEQALPYHTVTAFVRDPAKLDLQHPNLRVVQGDLGDPARVAEAIAGADAVVSVAGQTKTSRPDLLAVTARHIISGMEEHGVTRLVTLLGAGVSDPGDPPPSLGRRFMLGLMSVVAKGMVEDASQHADTLRASGLDWTIVRPPRLTDGEATGKLRHGYLRLGPMHSISRADLAAFILDLATSERYVREAPMVTTDG